MLYRSNLSYLVLENIKEVCGPKAEQDDLQAYFNSWLAHGLFGWINEWIVRGMKESPKEMAQLIKAAEQQSKIISYRIIKLLNNTICRYVIKFKRSK